MALLGCGGPDPSEEVIKEPARAEQTLLTDAKQEVSSTLHLENQGLKVAVNSTQEDALKVFADLRPDKTFEIKELPESLQPYAELDAAGWATGNLGYGLILRKKRVVLAMFTRPGFELSDIADVAATYSRKFPNIEPKAIDQKAGKYWFFNDGRHRLMICGALTRKDKWTLTIAVGDMDVMNKVRMSAELALQDALQAENEEGA